MLGQKHAQATSDITGNLEEDIGQIQANLAALRNAAPTLPDDPYLLYNTPTHSTEVINHPSVGATHQGMIEDILQLTEGLDMVSIFAAGTMAVGFANPLGQLNWFERENLTLISVFITAVIKPLKAPTAAPIGIKTNSHKTLVICASSFRFWHAPVKPLHLEGIAAIWPLTR